MPNETLAKHLFHCGLSFLFPPPNMFSFLFSWLELDAEWSRLMIRRTATSSLWEKLAITLLCCILKSQSFPWHVNAFISNVLYSFRWHQSFLSAIWVLPWYCHFLLRLYEVTLHTYRPSYSLSGMHARLTLLVVCNLSFCCSFSLILFSSHFLIRLCLIQGSHSLWNGQCG